MADPKLAPLIATTTSGGWQGAKGGRGSQPLLLQPWPAFLSGVALLAGTLWFFYLEIVYLEGVLLRFPPAFLLLPVSGVACLALALPMFVFLAFRTDFLNTNIIYPKHYLYVFRRTYSAITKSNGKVSKKTL